MLLAVTMRWMTAFAFLSFSHSFLKSSFKQRPSCLSLSSSNAPNVVSSSSFSFDRFDKRVTAGLESVDTLMEPDSWVLLLDGSLYNPDKISTSLPKIPSLQDAWTVFHWKAKARRLDFAKERFLYHQDIGAESVRLLAVARNPLDMHDKLVLGRKIAELIPAESHVGVVTLFPEGAVSDVPMTTAVYSAFQMHHNPMPQFKRHDPSAHEHEPDKVKCTKLTFVVPERDWNASRTDGHSAPSSPKPPLSLAEIMEQATQRTYGTAKNDDVDDSQSVMNITQLLRRASAVNFGTHICRSLAAIPPNLLSPARFRQFITEIVGERGWDHYEITPKMMHTIGCGAFLAVTQANPGAETDDNDDAIVYLHFNKKKQQDTASERSLDSAPHLVYRRAGQASDDPVVLVGKGVCYDTGGLSLKLGKDMKGMKNDMTGAAAALGTFLALDIIGEVDEAECWLALAENNIGPRSYRPDDVITTVMGETVEIVDTDAEGRLLLADTLALASRKVLDSRSLAVPLSSWPEEIVTRLQRNTHPAVVVDFATLTGSAITALTTRFIAVTSNNLSPSLLSNIDIASKQSGERAWALPVLEDFTEDLSKSDVADILQCLPSGHVDGADHLYAAAFLQRFVRRGVVHVHCDLASAHRQGGLGHVGSDHTGTGPRFIYELLRQLGFARLSENKK